MNVFVFWSIHILLSLLKLVSFTRKSEEFEIKSCTFNPNTKKCYPHDANGKPLRNEEFTPGLASPETCQTECARRYTYPISNLNAIKMIDFVRIEKAPKPNNDIEICSKTSSNRISIYH